MEISALLLNPPGNQRYLRDYFCSTVSKTGYYWHPIDLLIQSGFLSKHYNIKVIDAIAQHMSQTQVLHTILESKPEIILSMTSVLSYEQDMAFLSNVKNILPNTHIFAIGEPFLEQPQLALEKQTFLDGVLLGFINDDITAYMDKRFEDIKTMVFRKEGHIALQYNIGTRGKFSMPLPRHELFPLKHYWMPLIMHHPFASVLTTYGCPFVCGYCNSGANTMGFLTRDVEEVIDELIYIKKLGIRHVFIKDMTFGVPKTHASALCEGMINKNLDLTWHCYSRTDVIDEDMLKLMKRAGCNLIQFGVETANESTLKKYTKDISLDKTIRAFELAHRYSILTGAHFIFGLPGDSDEDMNKTVELAKRLKPAYVSFNIATPRYGTPLKNEFNNNGLHYSQNSIERNVKKANISFYIRPSYIFSLLSSIKTPTQLKSIIREGIGMIKFVG